MPKFKVPVPAEIVLPLIVVNVGVALVAIAIDPMPLVIIIFDPCVKLASEYPLPFPIRSTPLLATPPSSPVPP